MRYARLLTLFVIAVASPATAYAQDGWWAWLEQLSGPGYFQGPMGSFNVFCWKGSDPVPCQYLQAPSSQPRVERNQQLDKSLQVTVGWLTSNDRPRFSDLPASGVNIEHVIVVPVNVSFMFRPHRSIDVGPGAGTLLFYGPDVNVRARFLVTAAASWKFLLTKSSVPATRARRIFGFEAQAYYVTKGFIGDSFGSSTTTYKSPAEVLGTIGFSVDLREWR